MDIQKHFRTEDIKNLCGKINMPEEVCRKIEHASRLFDYPSLAPFIDLLFDIGTGPEGVQAIEESLAGREGRSFIWLAIWLDAALRTHERYRQMEIDDNIFYDTMGCFSRFVKEHMERYGAYGYDRSFWTVRQIAMQIFRLGTLEYEMKSYNGQDIIAGGKTMIRQGENILSVHIPSDARLDGENCHESYCAAASFFKKYYPDFQYNYFYTSTWLLSPKLQYLLAKDSGILNFQRDYTICSCDEENDDYRLWVFKNPALHPADFPEKTSLQRNIKQYILDGGKIGNGAGIIGKQLFMDVPQDRKNT